MSGVGWLHEAVELAKLAAREDEVPVGAVVVHEGKIIGTGYNRREQDQNPVAHAEILAIQSAARTLRGGRLVDCELYVTLEPCPMCLAACQQARVTRVTYGAKDPKGGAISLGYALHEDKRTHHRFTATHEPNEECGAVLKAFFNSKRSSSK